MTHAGRGWVSGIKVLSFDLDDTLWDCAPVIEKAEDALTAWFLEHAPKVVEQRHADALIHRRAEVVQQYPEIACDMTLLRRKIIEHTLQDAGYDVGLTDTAFEVFYRARSEVVLYERTHDVLEQLGKHYSLAVITNGNADLSLIGLDDYFQHIQRASIDNAPKPEAHMFDACLKAFDILPSELAHIGDNIETDVGGAANIGARTVWYNQANMQWPESVPVDDRKGQSRLPPRADVEVGSLQALLEFFTPE